MYEYSHSYNDIKESVRPRSVSLSHGIIRSFFVLHFHRISFEFFFFFPSPPPSLSLSLSPIHMDRNIGFVLDFKISRIRNKIVVRSPTKIFFLRLSNMHV